ncbi:helix-turn-helix domain-containing protein [Serratia nevei]
MCFGTVLQDNLRALPERVYQKGQELYGDGDQFRGPFVMMAGAVKSYLITADGEERMTGFFLPGEWFGLEGLPAGPYSGYAQALDTCCVRRIPTTLLAEFLLSHQGRHDIFYQLSDAIRKKKIRYHQMSRARADARLAHFILDLSHRICYQGYSGREFRLPMTRGDIANYLGLTPETISRAIARFEYLGILRFKKRYITLLQPDKLKTLADG